MGRTFLNFEEQEYRQGDQDEDGHAEFVLLSISFMDVAGPAV